MIRRWSLTLRQVFLLSLLGLAVLLGLLFYFVYSSSHQSILDDSRQLQQAVGDRLKLQVLAFRDQATDVTDDIERELQQGLIPPDDHDALEQALYTQVINHPDLSEVTFTHADAIGSNDFELLFAPQNHWRISVFRSADPAKARQIITQRISAKEGEANDPTTDYTFQTPIMKSNLRQPVWSDLHWSDLAPGGAASHSRVEVTVQKSIFDGDKFLGVMRVGLLEERLNKILQLNGNDQDRQYTCFLCDDQGRLITAVTPQDRLAVVGDDIRIQSPALPEYVAKAIAMPELHHIHPDPPAPWTPANGRVVAGGEAYLVSFIPLENVQDWVLGVIASEKSYLGDLLHTRDLLLADSVGVMAVILICGALTLRAVRRGLNRVMATTSRMREFDFSASAPVAPFRDMQAVLESLEQAKTAMRAMGKYVPIELVRDLYQMNREPMLGGELRELTIMFTDLQGFTSLAETLATDKLAVELGYYFQAMTAAIHHQGGTIDKYIGDSVMAIWNAPAPCENHAIKACAAALACAAATEQLFLSPQWLGMPPLVTRYGLHKDRVMVGHFGAPDRLSYTAQGDGVNLASRLEGLNKYYGTTILVSETVYQEAAREFHFRLLDRVAVKGRKMAVAVYELLGAAAKPNERSETIKTYESALRLYWERDFPGAWQLLQANPSDPPSRVLAERCRHFIQQPPPQDWQGEFMSTMK